MMRRLGQLFGRKLKKCLISRKSMKNRLFGQKLEVSGANYHGSGFGSTFR